MHVQQNRMTGMFTDCDQTEQFQFLLRAATGGDSWQMAQDNAFRKKTRRRCMGFLEYIYPFLLHLKRKK